MVYIGVSRGAGKRSTTPERSGGGVRAAASGARVVDAGDWNER